MENIFDEAVESVRQRGFHDTPPPGYTSDATLMAQYARLVEEVGELGRALREGDSAGVRYECADVVIVAAQIAHLRSIDLEHAIRNKCAQDEMRGWLHQNGGIHEGL